MGECRLRQRPALSSRIPQWASLRRFPDQAAGGEPKARTAHLKIFVTLSPVPGFARWLERERKTEEASCLDSVAKEILVVLDEPGWITNPEYAEKVRKVLLSATLLLPEDQGP